MTCEGQQADLFLQTLIHKVQNAQYQPMKVLSVVFVIYLNILKQLF